VQEPIPPRPTDLPSTSLRDLLASQEAHLTPLVNARLGSGEPEPVGRLRAHALAALVGGQAPAHRLTAMRSMTVAKALARGASAAHMAATLGLETAEGYTRRRSWADEQHQRAGTSAAARNEVHALPDDRRTSR
jgi:hypothetical protein